MKVMKFEERLALASNTEANPSELSNLRKFKDKRILRTLSRNPNTPIDILFELWESYPEEYILNPIRDYWSLASCEPELSTWPTKTRWSIYKHLISIDDYKSITLIFRIDERLAFASSHFSSDKDALERAEHLAKDASEEVIIKLLEYNSWDAARINMLASMQSKTFERLANHKSQAVREVVASFRGTPPHIRMILSADPIVDVRLALANESYRGKGAYVMRDLWETLANDEHPQVRARICKHYGINASSISKLSYDDDFSVRMAVAASPSISHDAGLLLADTADEKILLALAQNNKINSDLLEDLAFRELFNLWKAILSNRNASSKVIKYILSNCEADVQLGIFNNPRFDKCMLKKFSRLIGTQAKKELATKGGVKASILFELTNDSDHRVRLSLVFRLNIGKFHHETPNNLRLIDLLVNDSSPTVRAAIVHDFRISKDQLTRLGMDASSKVRRSVANNLYRTSNETLVALCDDNNSRVRKATCENILYRLQLHRTYQRYNSYFELYKRARNSLVSLSSDSSKDIRLIIANASESPPKALDTLLRYGSKAESKVVQKLRKFPYGAILDFDIDHTWPSNVKLGKTVSPCTPSSTALDLFSLRDNQFLKMMTARYHRTKISTLRALSRDPVEAISTTAINTLQKRLKK